MLSRIVKATRTEFSNGAGLGLNAKPARTNRRHRSKPVPGLAEVTFRLSQAEAHEVYVCGEFNDWSAHWLRMILNQKNGRREKRLILPAGGMNTNSSSTDNGF